MTRQRQDINPVLPGVAICRAENLIAGHVHAKAASPVHAKLEGERDDVRRAAKNAAEDDQPAKYDENERIPDGDHVKKRPASAAAHSLDRFYSGVLRTY